MPAKADLYLQHNAQSESFFGISLPFLKSPSLQWRWMT